MEQLVLTLVFLAVLFFLLGSGIWVGLSLLGVALTGMVLFTSRPVGDAMVTTIWSASSSWTLTALPLFIWMGEILFRTRLSADLFKGLAPWLGVLPGRLLHVNVAGCALFAAISGSSAATVATVGKMAIPELRRRAYPESMIIGTLAGAGTLGLLIPPSIILIVYGVTVNESIAGLFMAGVFPGIMLALLFMGYIVVRALIDPEAMPPKDAAMGFVQKLRASTALLPVVALIVAVLGSIYAGVATATEAAVLGVIGALLVSFLQGSLTRASFVESLMGAVRTSSMIALILGGAAFLSLAMGFTGLPRNLAAWIGSLELSPLALIVALTVFYIILGCFLDGISAVVLTMAVVEPMVRQAGFDMIWFGIFLVIVVEMAQITPPVGFNLFVLQGMTDHEMPFIARAALPMFAIMVLAVVLVVAFPEIATWLPAQMRAGP
ncbi:TRAP transporter large permease subunit [Pelagibius litoralis]|uniref:TRAP transporter large permease protein n=1 Tax=Pelagibius litoralis TaxID=374515 RepID=A0A967EVX0_9PROT|nr:TRAP transporter large permease subunit [Pelagibius litoralis]NIA68584.1 TRAP transporter large permease subunit [Pelagibius litoralis]